MKTVCAGCNVHLSGETESPADRVSHGICNDCLRRLYPEYAEEIIKTMEDAKGGSNVR